MPLAEADRRYAAILKALAPAVTQDTGGRKGFGSSSQLKVHGRIFAMLVRGDLVVKLPRQTVDAALAERLGTRFDPRRDGRLMKEWLVVKTTSKADWLALARQALTYVGKSGAYRLSGSALPLRRSAASSIAASTLARRLVARPPGHRYSRTSVRPSSETPM